MSQVNIEDFVNRHLVKVLWGIALYFLMQMANDFKEVKLTLQQILINQATIEARLAGLEDSDKKQNVKFDNYDAARTEFYKTYKLELKTK